MKLKMTTMLVILLFSAFTFAQTNEDELKLEKSLESINTQIENALKPLDSLDPAIEAKVEIILKPHGLKKSFDSIGNAFGVVQAKNILDMLINEGMANAKIYYALHKVELILGNINEAQEILKKAIDADNTNNDYRKRYDKIRELVNLLKDGQREFDASSFDDAKKIYEQALKDFPNISEINYRLGIIALYQDDYKSSADYFDKATSLAPNVDKYSKAKHNLVGKYYQNGVNALKLGDSQNASKNFNICVEIDPKFVHAYLQLGIIKVKSGNLDGAIATLKSGVKAAPENEVAQYNLGNFYKKAHRYSKAVVHLNKAVELNSNYSKAYSTLGSAYLALKKNKEAIKAFKKAIKLNDKSAAAWDGYGALLMDEKKYSEAIDALTKAVELRPRNFNAYYRIASCYNNLGKYNEAIESAKKSTKYQPRFGAAWYEMGIAYGMLGKKSDAISSFNRARADRRWRKTADYQIQLLRDGKSIQP